MLANKRLVPVLFALESRFCLDATVVATTTGNLPTGGSGDYGNVTPAPAPIVIAPITESPSDPLAPFGDTTIITPPPTTTTTNPTLESPSAPITTTLGGSTPQLPPPIVVITVPPTTDSGGGSGDYGNVTSGATTITSH